MREVVSFAEESCWSGDQLRSIRREIYFSVVCYGKPFQSKLTFEFLSDYGIWYDYDDDMLLEILQEHVPDVEWGWFVYHKKMDHSGIDIINPDENQVVGFIEVRKRSSQPLSGENLGGTVMYWDQVQAWKVARDDERRAQEQESTGEREDPVVD